MDVLTQWLYIDFKKGKRFLNPEAPHEGEATGWIFPFINTKWKSSGRKEKQLNIVLPTSQLPETVQKDTMIDGFKSHRKVKNQVRMDESPPFCFCYECNQCLLSPISRPKPWLKGVQIIWFFQGPLNKQHTLSTIRNRVNIVQNGKLNIKTKKP